MEYDENKVLTEWNYSAPNIFYMQISINILLTQVTSCVFMMGETFGPQKKIWRQFVVRFPKSGKAMTSCNDKHHNSNTGRRSRKKAPVYTFSNTRDNWQFAVSL